MKPLPAGLTLVNVATIAGLLLGIIGGGLDQGFAALALILGSAAAVLAWISTAPFSPRRIAPPEPEEPPPKSKRARRRMKLPPVTIAPVRRPRHLAVWAVGIVFALFAFRSFCWLLYIDGDHLKIQSPNNL